MLRSLSSLLLAATAVVSLAACSSGEATAPTPPPAGSTPVASVVVTTVLDTIEAYETSQLAATTRDAQGQPLAGRAVRWTSSDPAVATVDPTTGVLTGVDRGTVTITATSEGKSGTASRVVVIRYRSLVTGTSHACDLASGGIAWCWGLNGREGRLGLPTMEDGARSAVPVRVPGGHRFAQLAAFGRTTCALTLDGKAYCWGANGWGMLGVATSTQYSSTPVAVGGDHTFRQISVGAEHVCAVTATNAAWCWGHNQGAQLGTGDLESGPTPVAVSGSYAFNSMASGNAGTCGIMVGGPVWCWGSSALGQLGDGKPVSGANTLARVPQVVVGNHRFMQLSVSNGYACGVTFEGQGLCWGSNGGRFGNGQSVESSVPTPVSGGHAFRAISAGGNHACGVTTTDVVYCWGANGNGQLGATVGGSSATPVRAAGSLLAAEVSAATISTGMASYSCAIARDRLTTSCWGRNDVGQLGNGATTSGDAVNATPTIVQGQRPRD